MHSPELLSAKELLKVMPTDGSIAEIYKRHSPQKKGESSIPTWGGNHMELAPTLFVRLA
jgi:transposase